MLKSLHWTAWALLTAVLASMVGAASPRNLPKAIETQIELQLRRPNDPKVANDLGNLLVLARRPEEAEAAYLRAIELAPGDPVPLYNLALLNQRRGSGKEALEGFKQVVELDPGNAWAHYQMGALLEALDDKARAVAAYGRAFALDPELASPKVNPQVIESKWVVEAMLRGYREVAERPLAPRAYDDPNRIALLMISSPTEGEGAEGEAAGTEEEGEGSDASTRQARGLESSSAGEPEDDRGEGSDPSGPMASDRSGRKVLTSESLDKGSTLGEVAPSGRSRSRASRRPSSRQTSRTTATRRPSSRYVAPQSGSETVRSDTPTTDTTTATPRQRTTGRVRYRPSTRSTGNLDLELVAPDPDGSVPAG